MHGDWVSASGVETYVATVRALTRSMGSRTKRALYTSCTVHSAASVRASALEKISPILLNVSLSTMLRDGSAGLAPRKRSTQTREKPTNVL